MGKTKYHRWIIVVIAVGLGIALYMNLPKPEPAEMKYLSMPHIISEDEFKAELFDRSCMVGEKLCHGLQSWKRTEEISRLHFECKSYDDFNMYGFAWCADGEYCNPDTNLCEPVPTCMDECTPYWGRVDEDDRKKGFDGMPAGCIDETSYRQCYGTYSTCFRWSNPMQCPTGTTCVSIKNLEAECRVI